MRRRTWKTRALWLGAVGCLLFGSARSARAADEGRAFFDIGVKAYERAQYPAAIVAFQEAYRLTKRHGLLFSIAQASRRAYERDGMPEHLKDAIRYYLRYLAAHPKDERRQEVEAQLEKLKSLPDAKGWEVPGDTSATRTQLVIAANVGTARLTLDGQSVPVLPYAADVRSGTHHLEIAADGYAPYSRDVDVASDAVLPIYVELQRLRSRLQVIGNSGAEVLIDGVGVGQLPSPAFETTHGEHLVEVREHGHFTLRQRVTLSGDGAQQLKLAGSPTPRRIAGWALVGTGSAAVVAGGVLGYFALQKQADARELQDQPGMAPAFEDALAARNTLRLSAALTAGVGAAAVIGGAISIFSEGFGPPLAAPSARSKGALRLQASLAGLRLCADF
jgi:hypothetical protein